MTEIAFYLTILIAAIARYHWRKEEDDFVYTQPEGFEFYHNIISRHISYYNNLSGQGKQRFVQKVIRLTNTLKIEGREEFVVTDEVRVMICACITQLTFGFNIAGLPFLQGVLVFPGIFYSRLARNWVKGLAMNNGVVFISWPDFVKGYEHSTDTYNLGLHEFTHILKMQGENVMLSDKRVYEHYDAWAQIAFPVFSKIRNNEESFFREYAGTNQSEFFSVCVENFFEIPAEFEKELPHIYYHLCYLLNQNPLNATGDYELSEDDINRINQKLKHDLPVNRTLITNKEYLFWAMAARFVWGIAFIEFFVIIQSGLDFQLALLRMFMLTAIIFIMARWFHYRSWRDTFHISYLHYFGLKLLPLLLLLMMIIEALK